MRDTITVDGQCMTVAEFQAAKGLEVSGSLSLDGTGITALPEGLSVGGSLDIDPYEVTITECDNLKIGCQAHATEAWAAFTDSEIAAMDGRAAIKFWATWKVPLLAYAADVIARRATNSKAA